MFPKLSTSALALAIAISQAGHTATTGEPDLGTVRAATARFQDLREAVKAGYVRLPAGSCAKSEFLRQGRSAEVNIQYVRPELLGTATRAVPGMIAQNGRTDLRLPSVLIYEPRRDRSLRLIAVENLALHWIWRQDQDAQALRSRTATYQGMLDDPRTPIDEAHMFAPRYDLHVWQWGDNLKGAFVPFDPDAGCAGRQT